MKLKNCEKATRKQSKSDLLFKLRLGRITASIMKRVCFGNVDQPAISTANEICNGSREINTPAVKKGKKIRTCSTTDLC